MTNGCSEAGVGAGFRRAQAPEHGRIHAVIESFHALDLYRGASL